MATSRRHLKTSKICPLIDRLNISLLPPGEKALVAVSAGRDSVGLLHHLLNGSEAISELEVIHVDHGIRAEGQQEQGLVEKICQGNGVMFHGVTLDEVPSNETEAREGRYAQFIEVAKESGCTRVVTAHHREDQLETRLMNLLRGCSPQGLSGIPETRDLADGILLVRPALKLSKEELGVAAIEWCDDPTNQISDNVRNSLRNEIIPQLQSLYPRDLADSFESLVQLLSEDLLALKQLVPQEEIMSLEKFYALPEALQRRWLRRSHPLEKSAVDRGLNAAKTGKSCDLGGGIQLRIADGTISLRP